MDLLAGDEPLMILRLPFYEVKIKTLKAHFPIHRCHHCSKFSNWTVGDPLFSAVDPPTSIHLRCDSSCSSKVRTGLVFRKADCSDFLAFDRWHKDSLFDGLASKTGDEIGSHENLHDYRHSKSARSPCEFFIEDHLTNDIGCHASVFFFVS